MTRRWGLALLALVSSLVGVPASAEQDSWEWPTNAFVLDDLPTVRDLRLDHAGWFSASLIGTPSCCRIKMRLIAAIWPGESTEVSCMFGIATETPEGIPQRFPERRGSFGSIVGFRLIGAPGGETEFVDLSADLASVTGPRPDTPTLMVQRGDKPSRSGLGPWISYLGWNAGSGDEEGWSEVGVGCQGDAPVRVRFALQVAQDDLAGNMQLLAESWGGSEDVHIFDANDFEGVASLDAAAYDKYPQALMAQGSALKYLPLEFKRSSTVLLSGGWLCALSVCAPPTTGQGAALLSEWREGDEAGWIAGRDLATKIEHVNHPPGRYVLGLEAMARVQALHRISMDTAAGPIDENWKLGPQPTYGFAADMDMPACTSGHVTGTGLLGGLVCNHLEPASTRPPSQDPPQASRPRVQAADWTSVSSGDTLCSLAANLTRAGWGVGLSDTYALTGYKLSGTAICSPSLAQVTAMDFAVSDEYWSQQDQCEAQPSCTTTAFMTWEAERHPVIHGTVTFRVDHPGPWHTLATHPGQRTPCLSMGSSQTLECTLDVALRTR